VIARADVLEVTELDLEVDGDTFAPERHGWSVARVEPTDGWSVSRTASLPVPDADPTLIGSHSEPQRPAATTGAR
jgi:hypothetical protein